VADHRERVLGDLDAVDDAIGDLLDALGRYRASRHNTRSVVDGGGPVEDAFIDAYESSVRSTVSDALTTFERVRYRSRRSLIALSQDEGLPKERLNELLDISRQLANRWVKESRSLNGGDSGPDGPAGGTP
jgi:hypothetical protein